MSAANILAGAHSQIPLLVAAVKDDGRLDGLDKKNKKWTEKLKRRSVSTQSLFNVTHKVPSHIVSPKTPVKDAVRPSDEPPSQYRSNLELSNCWSHLGEAVEGKGTVSRDSSHNGERGLSLAWWQTKSFLTDPLKISLENSKEMSSSATNVYEENVEPFRNCAADYGTAPLSLPASQGLIADYANNQVLQKQLSHDLPPVTGMNSSHKIQFRSEQNLLNNNWPNYDYEMHSLDYGYGNRSLSKYNFDISTIKELPEDRSDSPAKHFLEDDPGVVSCTSGAVPRAASRRPSITDKYRSLQDLRQTFSENNQPTSLTASQSNILFETIPEHEVHDITTNFVENENQDCFRSIQDLRDAATHSYRNLQCLLDYQALGRNSYMSVQDLTREENSRFINSSNFAGCFQERDLSVSMIDIGHLPPDYNEDVAKMLSSKIPKRRHTITAQDISEILPKKLNAQGKSALSRNASNAPESKQDKKASSDLSSEAGHLHDRSKKTNKTATKSAAAPSGEKTVTLDRKKGCVGCQHKHERNPVVRQHSMPHTKPRAKCGEKSDVVRRPLTRSNSSPGEQTCRSSSANSSCRNSKQSSNTASNSRSNSSNTKSNKQKLSSPDESTEKQGLPEDSMTLIATAGEVSRLKEELEHQRRTIRQLTLRRENHYREDQPMSLGTVPSASMDSVYDGLLRPLATRGRHDSLPPSDWLSVIGDLREENRNLRSELQEARDQAELLEFRVLELTEGSDRFSESDEVCSVKEVLLEGGVKEGVLDEPSTGQQEDLSLPLSIDSGLDLTADCRKSRSAVSCSLSPKATPSLPNTSSSSPPLCPSTNGANLPPAASVRVTSNTTMNEEPAPESSKVDRQDSTESTRSSLGSSLDSSEGVTKMEDFTARELTELAAKLQESLTTTDPKQQEEALLEAINKLRRLDGSLSSLQSRVCSLTEENQYLQDALSALSDAQETRTEASGTESEIVNRKTPSLHSDLSDCESDSPSSSPSSEPTGRSSKRIDLTTSFQESGIFDGSCELVHVAVQTETLSLAGEEPKVSGPVQEDLSSAVARLTSIRTAVQGGGVHMRISDLQDAEDLLKGCYEDPGLAVETVDEVTAQLKVDLGRVRVEKQQLQEAYDALQLQISEESHRRCHETAEVDKGESRVLREQLRVSETSRKNLYDEKCELEEAENDARLMVQRLDSQLTAAREMELLLSASLSQEQEISRELHRKVKELQAQEKERILRQNVLERQSTSSVERVASLVMDRDSYASQLAFVRNGLILLQVFRYYMASIPGAVVPYAGRKLSHDNGRHASEAMQLSSERFLKSSTSSGSSSVMVNCAIDEALMEMSDESLTCTSSVFLDSSDPTTALDYSSAFNLDDMIVSKHQFCVDFLVPGLCDTGVQTEDVRFYNDFETEHFMSEELNEERFSACTLVPASDVFQSAGIGCSVEMKTKATMTVEEDLLSQRERYYLEQISLLQNEKMTLRKDQDQERHDTVQHCHALDASLQQAQQQLSHTQQQLEQSQFQLEQSQLQLDSTQDQLEQMEAQLTESEHERLQLQCRLDETRQQRELACQDLHRRMEEMRGDLTRCSDLHELEKKALRRDFDARLAEMSDERRRYSSRVSELEQQLTALRQELEVVGVAIVTDMTGYEEQPRPASVPAGADATATKEEDPTPIRLNSASDLLDRIRSLIKSESALRQKVTELERQENAYCQTMQRADQILNDHVTFYKTRIDELEAANTASSNRIVLLEKNEDRLRSSLTAGARTDHEQRVAELLQTVIDMEKVEMELKEKLFKLEKSEKQVQIKLMECEKAQQNLRAELRDQEELLQKMQHLQAENNAITQQVQQAHDSVRRVCEVQQSERFLKGRVEELEVSEQTLKEELQQAGMTHGQRERRFRDQVSALEEEILTFKSQLEASVLRESEVRDTEVALRKQLETMKTRLEEAERDLKESTAATVSYETQSRNEVCKLRMQLKLTNSQLSELDAINGNLKERLAASEQLGETLERQLEERKRRHESDLLQLNLQASQRESRLEETEGQLCELTQLHAAQELDLLASSALAPLLRSAHDVTTRLKLCDGCLSGEGATVTELNTQLSTLTDLLNGTSEDTEDNAEDSDDDAMEKTEMEIREDAITSTLFLHPTNSLIATIPSSTISNNFSLQSIPSSVCSSTSSAMISAHSSLTSGSFSTADDSSLSSAHKLPLTEGASPRPNSPVPVPAPRRKRKQKREDTASLRGSFRARKKGNTTILEELEEKVRELEESIAKKEDELRLADCEAAEMTTRLQMTQEAAAAKEAEVEQFRRALGDLQHQLALSIESHELTKIKLESKYKTGEESMATRLHHLALQLERLAARGRIKDHIIATLVTQIRAILRTTNMGVVVTQIRQINNKIELAKMRKEKEEELRQQHIAERSESSFGRLQFPESEREFEDEGEEEEQDFDVEAVCSFLEQPRETVQLGGAGARTSLMDDDHSSDKMVSPSQALTWMTLQQEMEAIWSLELSRAETASKGHNSLSSCTSATQTDITLYHHCHPLVEYVHKASQTTQSTFNLHKTSNSSRASRIPKPVIPTVYATTSSNKSVSPDAALATAACAPTVSAPHIKHDAPSAAVHGLGKPPVAPRLVPPKRSTIHRTASRAGARQECRPSTSYPPVSDARCIRRMLTGSAPIHAPVECFASPEFQHTNVRQEYSTHDASLQAPALPSNTEQITCDTSLDDAAFKAEIVNTVNHATLINRKELIQRNSAASTNSLLAVRTTTNFCPPKWRPAGSSSSNKLHTLTKVCKTDGTSCIPKPADLRVTRRVGVDGVVIAWSPLDHDCIIGFQVVVGGKVVQQVKSPDRTKAFIPGLPMTSSWTIGLISVGIDGRCSKPAVVSCDRSSLYTTRTLRRPALTRRTATPTCI